MAKYAKVVFTLDHAWEEWTIEVPDEDYVDKEWVKENIHDLVHDHMVALSDSGNSGMDFDEVVDIIES